MKDLKELKFPIKINNLDELQELLQKATDQLEQLKEVLQEIEEFKPVVKDNLKP